MLNPDWSIQISGTSAIYARPGGPDIFFHLSEVKWRTLQVIHWQGNDSLFSLLQTMKGVGALVSRSSNSQLACEHRRISGCHWLRLRSQANSLYITWECSLSHFYVVTLTAWLSRMFQLLFVVFSASVVSELRTVCICFQFFPARGTFLNTYAVSKEQNYHESKSFINNTTN